METAKTALKIWSKTILNNLITDIEKSKEWDLKIYIKLQIYYQIVIWKKFINQNGLYN